MAEAPTTTRHDERCPNCRRFVPADADGFYDRLDRDDKGSLVFAFCDEACADRYHAKRHPTHPDEIDAIRLRRSIHEIREEVMSFRTCVRNYPAWVTPENVGATIDHLLREIDRRLPA